MTDRSQTRLLCALAAAVTTGAAVVLADGLPPDVPTFASAVVPMAFGAGLAQWLLFPLFARRPAPAGLLLDAALYVALIALAGLFAGTLVMPGAGTILGPILLLSVPLRAPLAALAFVAGAVFAIWSIRRAQPHGQQG
jgi:hypothetical protein